MKESITSIHEKAKRRAARVRAKAQGTADIPRMSVNVSGRHLFVQCIDDEHQKTLVAVSDRVLGKSGISANVSVKSAQALGKKFAELALGKGIEKVKFDRGARSYHGRLKAFAEAAREGGLKF